MKLATGRIAEKADGRLQLQTRVAGKNPAIDAKVDLSGDYRIDVPAKTYAFSKVDGDLKGTLEKDAVEAKLAAPRIEKVLKRWAGWLRERPEVQKYLKS